MPNYTLSNFFICTETSLNFFSHNELQKFQKKVLFASPFKYPDFALNFFVVMKFYKVGCCKKISKVNLFWLIVSAISSFHHGGDLKFCEGERFLGMADCAALKIEMESWSIFSIFRTAIGSIERYIWVSQLFVHCIWQKGRDIYWCPGIT